MRRRDHARAASDALGGSARLGWNAVVALPGSALASGERRFFAEMAATCALASVGLAFIAAGHALAAIRSRRNGSGPD